MDILEKVKEILVDNLGCSKEDISLESNLIEDLGADSLDVVDLALELEESFDITIPDEDVENLQTVGAIVDYIKGS